MKSVFSSFHMAERRRACAICGRNLRWQAGESEQQRVRHDADGVGAAASAAGGLGRAAQISQANPGSQGDCGDQRQATASRAAPAFVRALSIESFMLLLMPALAHIRRIKRHCTRCSKLTQIWGFGKPVSFSIVFVSSL